MTRRDIARMVLAAAFLLGNAALSPSGLDLLGRGWLRFLTVLAAIPVIVWGIEPWWRWQHEQMRQAPLHRPGTMVWNRQRERWELVPHPGETPEQQLQRRTRELREARVYGGGQGEY